MGKLHATPDCWIVLTMIRDARVQSDHQAYTAARVEAPGQAIPITTTSTETRSSLHRSVNRRQGGRHGVVVCALSQIVAQSYAQWDYSVYRTQVATHELNLGFFRAQRSDLL